MRSLCTASLSIMANVEEEQKHKMKFDSVELEVLVEEANKHLNNLQQSNVNITKRNLIWSSICAKVNAIRKTKRTEEEVKVYTWTSPTTKASTDNRYESCCDELARC